MTTTHREYLAELREDCPRVQSACPGGDGLCAHHVTGHTVTISDPPRVLYDGWGECAWRPGAGRWETVILYPIPAPRPPSPGSPPVGVALVLIVLWAIRGRGARGGGGHSEPE